MSPSAAETCAARASASADAASPSSPIVRNLRPAFRASAVKLSRANSTPISPRPRDVALPDARCKSSQHLRGAVGRARLTECPGEIERGTLGCAGRHSLLAPGPMPLPASARTRAACGRASRRTAPGAGAWRRADRLQKLMQKAFAPICRGPIALVELRIEPRQAVVQGREDVRRVRLTGTGPKATDDRRQVGKPEVGSDLPRLGVESVRYDGARATGEAGTARRPLGHLAARASIRQGPRRRPPSEGFGRWCQPPARRSTHRRESLLVSR